MIGTMDRTVDEADTSFAGSGTAHSPLGRYARYQIKDFVRQRAPIMLIVAAIMTYPLLITSWGGRTFRPEEIEELRRYLLYVMVGAIVPLGTLMGMRGIVSEDRAQGFHRFLFAKPVNMLRYYAQSFAVQFAGITGIVALVALLYTLFVASVPLAPVFIASTAFFMLFGGVTFFFSTISRNEWLWTLLAFAVTIWTKAMTVWGYTALKPLYWALLPLESFGRMMSAFYPSDVRTMLANAVLPVLYGAGAFVAGLFVLRKRSLSA